MIECPLCSCTFPDRRLFAIHMRAKHKEYSDLEREEMIVYTLFGEEVVENIIAEYLNENYCITGLPIDVSKLIKLRGIKRTSSEERKTSRYKDNFTRVIQETYGSHITNISQIPSVKEKKLVGVIEKYGCIENFAAQKSIELAAGYQKYFGSDKYLDTLKLQEDTCLARYGNKNFGAGTDAKRKSKITRAIHLSKLTYDERLSMTHAARSAVYHRGGYCSKPEKRVRSILESIGIVCDYNKMLFGYNWDIVIGKLLIEVQGLMWHGKPSHYSPEDSIMSGKILVEDIWIKDKRKCDRAVENGYSVAYIWEDEIKSSSDEELKIILKGLINEYEASKNCVNQESAETTLL